MKLSRKELRLIIREAVEVALSSVVPQFRNFPARQEYLSDWIRQNGELGDKIVELVFAAFRNYYSEEYRLDPDGEFGEFDHDLSGGLEQIQMLAEDLGYEGSVADDIMMQKVSEWMNDPLWLGIPHEQKLLFIKGDGFKPEFILRNADNMYDRSYDMPAEEPVNNFLEKLQEEMGNKRAFIIALAEFLGANWVNDPYDLAGRSPYDIISLADYKQISA